MKIFTASDIRVLEKCAVDAGLTMDDLMEKAGGALAAFLKRQWEIKAKAVVILCGKGNNGGDGFVAARKLSRNGAKVTVVLAQGESSSNLAKKAYDKMGSEIEIIHWEDNKFKVEELLETADFILDCIFGFSFKGKIEGSLARLVNAANKSEAEKVSADLPSGVECDTGSVSGPCFRAAHTINFTGIKPGNVLSPGSGFCGKNVIAPVGIDRSIVDTYPSSFSVIREQEVKGIIPIKASQSNKGDFGRLLMICGSYGMVGALIMSAKAALRSGLGLLNIAVDKELYPVVAAAVPEAIFTVLDFSTEEESAKSAELLYDSLMKSTACVIGCGCGEQVKRYLSTVIKFSKGPILIDADGLNAIAENTDELANARADIVLTPHPGEMSRLSKKTVHGVQADRYGTAKSFSSKHGVITVLKGAGTIIAAPDGEMRININGNAGMAKGGSGDVLAGLMAGLLAQGIAPLGAAVAAVFIHGKAGDIASAKLSKVAMLPTDLVETLPGVFLGLE